ncbi:MAG: hypothetical protein FWH05_02565 [Oscillospiraceae bacterium]|nr:hypothetical protein [Oscillospiraceae bacterium]
MNQNKKLMTPALIVLLSIFTLSLVGLWYVYLVMPPVYIEEFRIGDREPDLKGTGEPITPYLIETIYDLEEFAFAVNNGSSYRGKHFLLTADINMTDYLSSSGAGYNDGAGWIMIGRHNGTSFSGYFDGGGHTISGLWINRPDEISTGLFAWLYEAEIYNLNVEATTIVTESDAGTLAGTVWDGKIANCSSTIENISSTNPEFKNYLGGLVGFQRFDSIIENCRATTNAEFHAEDLQLSFGGLVGSSSENSRIINSHSIVNLEIHSDERIWVGGLVGDISDEVVIDNSYSVGNVKATGDGFAYVGGLMGESYGDAIVKNSYSECTVIGSGATGGLIGFQKLSSVITDSYATGDISVVSVQNEYAFVGGLVGESQSDIKNSYATGNVLAEGDINVRAGGLVGRMVGGEISDCFATGDVNITKGDDTEAGGLVGRIERNGVIRQSYATGNVSAFGSELVRVGGLVGCQTGYEGETPLIENCYATGSISGDALWYYYTGGLVGVQGTVGSIINSYAIVEMNTNNQNSGGLIAWQLGKVENCYFDAQILGVERASNRDEENAIGEGNAKTTAQMQTQETFIDWDFDNIWYMPEEGGAPELRK